MIKNDSGTKSATGLTGTGTRDWIVQRVSAVILAVYSLVILGFFLMHSFSPNGVTYLDWLGFMTSLPMRLFNLLAILALVGHAWVGIWTILTDYIKSSGMRLVLQSAMIIAILVYLAWGMMIFWGIGLTPVVVT